MAPMILLASRCACAPTCRMGRHWRSVPFSRQVLPVRVVEATQDYVKLDYNHPLADKTLMYTLHLVDVVDE